MCKRALSILLCGFFCAFFSLGTPVRAAVFDLGELSTCKRIFACGNSFNLRANYRIYDIPDLSHFTEIPFDYDDGGFRGWGTIVPIPLGTRTRYFHLTFDRHNGSDYNWSYGNLYCFEGLEE